MGYAYLEIIAIAKEESIMYERTCKLIEDGNLLSILYFDKNGKVISKEKHNIENVYLSDCQIKRLAKALLKSCVEFYSDPENGKQKENRSNMYPSAVLRK